MRAKPNRHLDAGMGQRREAARRRRIGVAHGGNHARHPGLRQALGARRRAPVVGAGLQAHVRRRPAGTLTGRIERMDFRVGLAGATVPAFTDYLACVDDHATHARVGVGAVEAAAGEPQRARHEAIVVSSEHDGRSTAACRRS